MLARSSAVDCTTFEPHTSLFPLVSKACYYSPIRSHVMCQLCVNRTSTSCSWMPRPRRCWLAPETGCWAFGRLASGWVISQLVLSTRRAQRVDVQHVVDLEAAQRTRA